MWRRTTASCFISLNTSLSLSLSFSLPLSLSLSLSFSLSLALSLSLSLSLSRFEKKRPGRHRTPSKSARPPASSRRFRRRLSAVSEQWSRAAAAIARAPAWRICGINKGKKVDSHTHAHAHAHAHPQITRSSWRFRRFCSCQIDAIAPGCHRGSVR
jgi:hypothetical protein